MLDEIPGIVIHAQEEIIPSIADAIITIPPKDKCKVVNIYVDPNTNKTMIEYDDNKN